MKKCRSIYLMGLVVILLGLALQTRLARADGGGSLPTATATATRTPVPDSFSVVNPEDILLDDVAATPMRNITAPASTSDSPPSITVATAAVINSTGDTLPLGPLGAILLVIAIFVALGLLFFRKK
jgi:hypothetical protein